RVGSPWEADRPAICCCLSSRAAAIPPWQQQPFHPLGQTKKGMLGGILTALLTAVGLSGFCSWSSVRNCIWLTISKLPYVSINT
uniref:Uncharacterized protein n=1 Tax=Paramormyrops kingsleyae TaxID=1676925 RepID=A0A3B3SQK0_9TELE